MAKLKVLIANELRSRHRFHCNTCGDTGKYFPTVEQAAEDGRNHKRKPGNRNHDVMVETETRNATPLEE